MALPKIREQIEARVKDTGDTMTDVLYIDKASQPGVAFNNTTTGQRVTFSAWENSAVIQTCNVAGDTNNRRNLFLKNSNAVSGIANSLTLRDYVGGTSTEYKLYGEHNKDLIKAFCLPIEGGTLTGCVMQTVSGNPYYGLNDGTNNWYFQAIKADNACYIGPTSAKALKIDTNGNMTAKGTIAVNTEIIPVKAGGAKVGTGSLPFLQTVARNHYLYDTNNAQTGRLYTGKVGTASEIGFAYVMIGNNKASGTISNAKGFVVLYGDQTYYSQLVPANGLTANRTITLPNASGTVALTGHTHAAGDIASGTLSMARGGTGSTSRTEANQNLSFIGTNPITSTANDTTANWAAQGTGHAFYSTNGYLIGQPSQYGVLVNFIYASEVFQLFNQQAYGGLNYRSGNSSGWDGSSQTINGWKRIYDTGNIQKGNWSITAGSTLTTNYIYLQYE